MKYVTKLLLLIALSLIACQDPKELSPARYARWVSSEDHGFVKTKKVKEISLQARFLPAEYQAYREFSRAGNQLSFDSVLASYGCGLTFQVKLSAEKTNKQYSNLVYYNVSSHEEALSRINFLNFRIEDFIAVQYKDKTFKPVLSHFEGYNELENSMVFLVNFVLPEYPCQQTKTSDFGDLTVTFEDPFWGLGTNHFLFDKELFLNAPRLKR